MFIMPTNLVLYFQLPNIPQVQDFQLLFGFVTMVPPETNELKSKYHKIKLSLYFLLSAHAKQKPPYLLFEDEKWRLIMKRLDKTIMQFHENRVEEEIKGWRIYNTTSTQTLYKSQLPKDTFKKKLPESNCAVESNLSQLFSWSCYIIRWNLKSFKTLVQSCIEINCRLRLLISCWNKT